MDKIPCTVGILTFNSGATLRRALESVKEFDDIVVCDGGSTDNTLAIAREYGANIIAQDSAFKKEDGSLKDYAGVRNQCVDVARYDWFFYIDSDEYAEPTLVKSIRKIVREPSKFLIYNIAPRLILDGVRIDYSSNYPGWQKRFFNKISGARFRKPVHERIGYDEEKYPAGYLKGHWYYYVERATASLKNKKYAYMDATAHVTRHTGAFLKLVVIRLLVLTKVILKILWNAIIHPGKHTLPFALEWTRVQYHIYFLERLWAGYRGKTV